MNIMRLLTLIIFFVVGHRFQQINCLFKDSIIYDSSLSLQETDVIADSIDLSDYICRGYLQLGGTDEDCSLIGKYYNPKMQNRINPYISVPELYKLQQGIIILALGLIIDNKYMKELNRTMYNDTALKNSAALIADTCDMYLSEGYCSDFQCLFYRSCVDKCHVDQIQFDNICSQISYRKNNKSVVYDFTGFSQSQLQKGKSVDLLKNIYDMRKNYSHTIQTDVDQRYCRGTQDLCSYFLNSLPYLMYECYKVQIQCGMEFSYPDRCKRNQIGQVQVLISATLIKDNHKKKNFNVESECAIMQRVCKEQIQDNDCTWKGCFATRQNPQCCYRCDNYIYNFEKTCNDYVFQPGSICYVNLKLQKQDVKKEQELFWMVDAMRHRISLY